MTTLILRGGKPYGDDAKDVVIRDGMIAELTAPGAAAVAKDADEIDVRGQVLLPGLVDLHTHLREPGRESAETVATGSRAAAKGGYTTVFAMPNTQPVADTAGVVEAVWALGREAGLVDVYPIGAVTVGRAGEQLAELGSMAHSRAQVRVFSDDGDCVADALVMRRALEYVRAFDGVIAQHAQDPSLTVGAQMHEGAVAAELGLAGWPVAAEATIVARDALLAEQTASRVHVCHVSTAAAVDVVRWAKARGINITAEVTPHHLMLTDELVRGYDARYKVNPPLRTQADVDAVRAALADGTIDVVATDHAPHGRDAKTGEWAHAAMGMVGLETALRVVVATMVVPGLLDWRGVARVMSEAPAMIGRAQDAGRPLAVGEPANILAYNPLPPREFTAAELAGKSANSPFLGMQLPGEVTTTIYRGHVTVRAGRVLPREETR